jgi:hypothetical protein
MFKVGSEGLVRGSAMCADPAMTFYATSLDRTALLYRLGDADACPRAAGCPRLAE